VSAKEEHNHEAEGKNMVLETYLYINDKECAKSKEVKHGELLTYDECASETIKEAKCESGYF